MSIPGSIDPVPCPDGKLLTVPGLSLYEVSTVLREGDNAAPILNDSSHEGVYQSCAVLSRSGSTTTYRVVTDSSGEVAYRDYKVTYRPNLKAQVKPLARTKMRCPNLNLKTIIVSKTGKYLLLTPMSLAPQRSSILKARRALAERLPILVTLRANLSSITMTRALPSTSITSRRRREIISPAFRAICRRMRLL